MPHEVDIFVGKRIRHRRWKVGITQAQLADSIGIKFQQVQKYETGANRVSASKLWEIADTLGVPISHFFEGMDNPDIDPISEELHSKEAADLVRAYYSVPPNLRSKLLDLTKSLAA